MYRKGLRICTNSGKILFSKYSIGLVTIYLLIRLWQRQLPPALPRATDEQKLKIPNIFLSQMQPRGRPKLGDKVTLICLSLNKIMTSSINWTFNNETLEPNAKRHVTFGCDSTSEQACSYLKISLLTLSEVGEYACSVSHERHSEVSSTLYLSYYDERYRIMSLSDDLIDWGIETIFSERFWLGVLLIVLMGVQFSVFFTMIRCFFVQ